MIFWGMIRGHDLGYDSGVWFAQIENHAFSKICTRSKKTQPNMSQLFLEDFALCCTGRSWLVSYLAQVSIYTLHTCRTMVEFGTIQQSRRSASHASCRHAKIGIISTQFGPRPLSKHVQALSWCPPASAMSGWASSPDASSSKRSPKASPGFWLNTNAFTHASRKSEGIQKRARSEAKALRVASSVLGVPGLIRLKTPSSWVRVCTCGTEVLVVESLSKAKKHRSRCSCSKIPHGHGCIYRLQWATKRRHGHQWTYANQSGSTRMTGSSPQTNQTVTSRRSLVRRLQFKSSYDLNMRWKTCALCAAPFVSLRFSTDHGQNRGHQQCQPGQGYEGHLQAVLPKFHKISMSSSRSGFSSSSWASSSMSWRSVLIRTSKPSSCEERPRISFCQKASMLRTSGCMQGTSSMKGCVWSSGWARTASILDTVKPQYFSINHLYVFNCSL